MLKVSVILKRRPLISRTLTGFESSYLSYREHVQAEQARPFEPSFYLRKGSLAEKRWNEAQLAHSQSFQADKVSDEVLLNVQPLDPEMNDITLAPRVTLADETNDLSSLDRALERTLYLVLKKDGSYTFPTAPVPEDQLLHQAAQTALDELGPMDTWIVGKVPVGADESRDIFYIKANILAGKPKGDHLWVTKQELATHMSPQEYSVVSDILSDY